jgi:D-glycero-alpha-D-manno-heptose-7-phosphate kinase
MIITKTPLRVSFFGGGSDIPQFYNNNRGLVISTTIDRPIYIAVNGTRTPHTKVVYSEIEIVDYSSQLKHDRVREVLQYYGISNHIEIASFSDIPTKGTGLGSSSTFTVGLLKAILEMSKTQYNNYELAELACHIEIDKCNQPIGKQDQYAATFGGFNAITFEGNEAAVIPINITTDTTSRLNDNLICFNTGITRQASSILEDQVKGLKNVVNIDNTVYMVDMAEDAFRFLIKGQLDNFGSLLGDSWDIKKKLSSNISNSTIDEMYSKAMKAGALGGKILGAGGGGYLLMYVPLKSQTRVIKALSNYDIFDFKFTNQGSVVEMNK